MCVRTIVDASAFRHLLEPTKESAGNQLRIWIERGSGIIVFSRSQETHRRELNLYRKVCELLATYSDRGRAREIDAGQIESALSQIPGPPDRESDDPHILALAVAGRATVLFSRDRKLRKDFANTRVIDKVGRQARASVPDLLVSPEDAKKAANRRKFLEARRCPGSA